MSIWKRPATLDQLRERSKGTLMEHLGIEYLEIGADYLKARMPVEGRTMQTSGILHGGASAALAETLGSIGAHMCLEDESNNIVGLEINANHLRPVAGGWVTGIARPLHVGRSTQVWEIRLFSDQEQLVCISRLTVANLHR